MNNPTATNDSITHDKWFKTGDIAIRDKTGYYYIVDRRKELIKYKVRVSHSLLPVNLINAIYIFRVSKVDKLLVQ